MYPCTSHAPARLLYAYLVWLILLGMNVYPCTSHVSACLHYACLVWFIMLGMNVYNRLLILFRKVHDVTLVWKFQFLLIGWTIQLVLHFSFGLAIKR